MQIPVDHAKTVKIAALVITILGLFLLPSVKFDINTLNLQSDKNESVKTYHDLLADSDTTPWSSNLLSDDRDTALKIIDNLNSHPLVDHVVWLGDFVPENQDEKLLIIDEMILLLGDISQSNINIVHTVESDPGYYVDTLRSFADTIREDDPSLQLVNLKNNLNNYLSELSGVNRNERMRKLTNFEDALLESFAGRYETLKNALNAVEISEDNIPQSIRSRWKSAEGKYLIEIVPVENLNNNDSMKRFVKGLQKEYPQVIGSPVIMVEAGEAVVRSFLQAFISALIVITLILIVLQRNLRDTITTLLPILLAAIMTAMVCVIFDIQINFANIIALPLLLGIGVDSAIHIIHRHKTAPPGNGLLLTTSSSRAVLVSAFTTITSIGNLAFSPHLGTASIGLLLSIGVTMTLICSLIVLPSFLNTKK